MIKYEELKRNKRRKRCFFRPIDLKKQSETNKYIYQCKSNECYCGDSYGSQGTSSNCLSICSQNQNEFCGGDHENSIYETTCTSKLFSFLSFFS